ncbi:DUF5615 family PIN-like protein [Candidatus Poribacteria bacterium]|nr:DUF5615 family PIN-like protein [Candidatus Poribacteria bacterium]
MFPALVADMNIAASVVQFLRDSDVDVIYTDEQDWHNLTDTEILNRAHAMNRFVLTHDSDFGNLAIHHGQPITGILYLRPGDRPSAQVITDLQDLLDMEVDWTPPLIAVYQSGRLRLHRPRRVTV